MKRPKIDVGVKKIMTLSWDKENPNITKRGATEYIETNKGFKKLRAWDPRAGDWQLTNLGKRFFRERPSEYIISLPVHYNIIRARDNAEIQCRCYISIANLNAGLRALMEEIMARNGNAPDLVARLRTGILSEITRVRGSY